MVFDAPAHRNYLHSLKNYVATAVFLSRVGWGQDGSANMLVDKTDKDPAVLVVVGKVVHDRVYCGPSGNWSINNKYGSLKEAKYQFSIGRPDEDMFAKEFDVAFKTLGKIQAAIASTQDRQHLLMGENDKVNKIRFSANVFEQRDVVSEFFDTVYPLLTDLNSPSKCQLSKHPTLSDFLTPFICQMSQPLYPLMHSTTALLVITRYKLLENFRLQVSHFVNNLNPTY
jgi:hypothetical protein